jgi:type I restriction enzyme S subunit
MSGTSGRQRVPTTAVGKYELNLPSLAEQRRIAHILGTLDDKIELNQRMNTTLEAIARAIFKSWFVDFDPVRAKAAGRPSGLPPALDALFPSRFVDSELGEIPEGWEVRAIGDVVEVVGGGTPSTKNPEYWEGGTYAFATPKDLSSITSPILLKTEKKVTEAGLEKISSGLLPKGTLLMSSRAPVGYLAISAIPACINQGFIGMKCDKLSNYFVLNWAQENMSLIQATASGTTFPEISKANFRHFKILMPAENLSAAFNETAHTLYSRITHSLKQNITLSGTRDGLLPFLLREDSRIEEPHKLS